MEIRVHTDNHITGSENFFEKYSEELNKKLHRFTEYLSGADIYFVDENKAKASINDKKCTIEIKIKNKPPEAVSHNADTINLAFNGAIDKMNHLLDSRIGKLHNR